jgi:hypothetical protein
MYICRAEIGNESQFRCPYHGWTFAPTGRLLGAPVEREIYDTGLDKANLGLRRARVETYAGVIFANWDAEAPDLSDFLGDYKFYLDLLFNRTDLGMEVIGRPQRFLVRANWKTASNQSNADNYHGFTLHENGPLVWGGMSRAYPDLAVQKAMNPNAGLQQREPVQVGISSDRGHGAILFAERMDRTSPSTSLIDQIVAAPPFGLPEELVPQLERNLTEPQLRMLARFGHWTTAAGIFPNVGYLYSLPHSAMSFRTYSPRSVDTFEMWSWALVEKGSSQEHKERALKTTVQQFGSSGMTEQDDAETWPAMHRSAQGFMGRQLAMKYQAVRGHNPPEGWEAPCTVSTGSPTRDDSQWMWWMRYLDYMTGKVG